MEQKPADWLVGELNERCTCLPLVKKMCCISVVFDPAKDRREEQLFEEIGQTVVGHAAVSQNGSYIPMSACVGETRQFKSIQNLLEDLTPFRLNIR
ncbi:MAG: hypothetical protein L0Y72_26720 [Gemmataceae bacterium]|nr:hypothetical protein [Gemmataceae bacterium]